MASELTEALLAEMNRYLNDEMDELERKRFERKLENDEKLRKELVLEKELREVLNEDSDYTVFNSQQKNEELSALKTKLRSDEYQELSNTIKSVGKEYLENEEATKPRKNYYKYISLAAVLVLFFGIYFSQINTSLDSYYEANVNWNELPSFTEKGQQEDLFSQGEMAFKASNYEEAIAKFTQIETTHELYVYSLQYLGASYDLLNKNDKAITTFQKLANIGNTHQHSKGNWYEALMHLKNNDREKAITTLEKSAKNPKAYKHKEAKELIEEIKK